MAMTTTVGMTTYRRSGWPAGGAGGTGMGDDAGAGAVSGTQRAMAYIGGSHSSPTICPSCMHACMHAQTSSFSSSCSPRFVIGCQAVLLAPHGQRDCQQGSIASTRKQSDWRRGVQVCMSAPGGSTSPAKLATCIRLPCDCSACNCADGGAHTAGQHPERAMQTGPGGVLFACAQGEGADLS
jgi:hypothetical protein